MQGKLGSTLVCLSIGLSSFFIVTGGAVLPSDNIAWLSSGDAAVQYLGWAFFRQDKWSVPLGLNPTFGLELGNSVVYSDSIPLLAILFKTIEALLPSVFQYFGLWILACFVLQAVFAWKVCGFVLQDLLARSAMTGFFTVAPPMLMRLPGHISLGGHFLILAAIYLALASRERRRAAAFVLLLNVAAGVHAYFLVMVGVIWLASLADGLIRHSITRRHGLWEFAAGVVSTSFVCWQLGYFTFTQGLGVGSYGFYHLNLLSLVDPHGWSYFLPSIPMGPGDYEGFNYLGVGVLLLLLAAIPMARAGLSGIRRQVVAMPMLTIAMAGLMVFAISNFIGIANFVVEIPIPHAVYLVISAFRASGRMFWPIYYLIVLAILFLFVRAYGVRRARWLLPLALVVQVADTSAGWPFRGSNPAQASTSTWGSKLTDPFWSQAAKRYSKVRWLLPANTSPEWLSLSYFAATHGLATNAVYLARTDNDAVRAARDDAQRRLLEGRYEADTLYVLDAPSARIARDHLNERDMMAVIDGFQVLAPGWRSCGTCRQY
ncbi:MAG: DUF6311 domain-containing protein [Reyranellaceae bacterium]